MVVKQAQKLLEPRGRKALFDSFLNKLNESMGLNPITIVAVSVALSQGMNQISDLPTNYLYKEDYGFGPVAVSFIVCFTSLPWIIKPLWGAISDNVTFFGYRRKSYLILWSILQFCFYVSLATWVRNKWLGILILMLIQVCIAFNNVIGEALLVEAAQNIQDHALVSEEQKQAEASKNVSMFFGVRYFGILTTAYLGGLLLEYISKYTVFLIAGFLPCLILFTTFVFMPEKRKTSNPSDRVPYHDIPDDTNHMNTTNSIETAQTRDQSTEEEFEEDAELHSELHISGRKSVSNWHRVVQFVKKPVIFRPILFLLLFMITPTCSSAMFYFYTNELKFSPDFMGKLKFANSFASLSGVFIFNRYLKNVPFQKILFWSTIICVTLGSTQIILVNRWNTYLGIPDKLFSVGDSLIIQTFGEINYMPVLVLACRICPKNLEGTMYALLMSTINLGGMFSSQLGGALAYLLGVNENNFSNLWALILIANITMLLPLPFLRLVKFDDIVQETEKAASVKRRKQYDSLA